MDLNNARSGAIGRDEESFLIEPEFVNAQEKQSLPGRLYRPECEHFNEHLDLDHAAESARTRLLSGKIVRLLPRMSLVIAFAAATSMILAFSLTTTTGLRGRLYGPGNYRTESSAQSLRTHYQQPVDGIWPESLGAGGTTLLCDICDCAVQPGFYAPKATADRYLPRASQENMLQGGDVPGRDTYMRQSILDIFCGRQHMSTSETTRIVRRTASHLEEMVSWNITGLDVEKPTIYLTTNTSPNGKASVFRPQYFRRHARAILEWQEKQLQQQESQPWQVLWLIVEDELDIDPEIIKTLRRIGVPYVYFAYGPTNGLGHAQRNAAMQLIYTLTQSRSHGGILGHGPVYCLDDDNKMDTELLTLLTRLDRIGVFPVGNFGVQGGYEKPIVSPIGEVMGSNSPWPNRTYPFDNAGFAFNSSLLGTQISGPAFWKWNKYGGESEFISQVVSDVRQLEPLCGHDEAQECHLAWHNEPLAQLESLTDDAETAFLENFGWDIWRGQLDDQLRARVIERGY